MFKIVRCLRIFRHLSNSGLDYMLTADFRQFIHRILEVDVSFNNLLSKTTRVANLAKLLADELHDSNTVNSTKLNPSV